MAINKVNYGGQTLIDTSEDTAEASDVLAGKSFHSKSGAQSTGTLVLPEPVITTGMIVPYAGNSAPEGWLFCDGSAVSRTDYSLLYAVIGTTYGVGDGSTTFNLPDLKGRVPVGEGVGTAHGTTFNLGVKDGVEYVTLTENQIPSHVGHLGSNSGISYIGTAGAYMATNNNIYYYGSAGRGWSITGNEASPAGVSRGGGQSHTNMQPYQVVNYIISTGETTVWSEDSSDTIVRGVLVDGQSVVNGQGIAEISLAGKMLYDNDANTSSTVQLSETAANFDKLDIYYTTNDALYSSMSVLRPNNKKITLPSHTPLSNPYDYFKCAQYLISGITISVISNNYIEVAFNTSNHSMANTFHVYITQVVGYKHI